MKKLFSLMLTLAMAVSVAASGSEVVRADAVDASNAEIVIKCNTPDIEGMPTSLYFERVAERLAEASEGRIRMDIYYSGALGNNVESLEALQLGTLEVACSSIAVLGSFTTSTHLFDLPYLFVNEEAAREVCDGEAGQKVLKDLEEIGIHGLGWMSQGWRNLTSNKEIHTPADMAGHKIRCMDNEIHLAAWAATGASPIPMAFSELYTALQNGTIEDEENSWGSFVSAKLYEVQHYVIMTRHIFDAIPITVSDIWWQTLSAEDQKLIEDAFAAELDWEWDYVTEWCNEYRSEIEALGNEVIDLTDEERQVFRDTVSSVYEQYGDEIGRDLIDSVEAVNDKYR